MHLIKQFMNFGTRKAGRSFPPSRALRRFIGEKRGSLSVEFGLLAPIFLLLVFGIVDFGHAWYMKMEITSASREGARYATKYLAGSTPSTRNPSVSNWIVTNYGPLLPANANLQVQLSGTGYTTGTAGQDVIVQVQATKTWFVIGNLVPGLADSITMTATTDMKVE